MNATGQAAIDQAKAQFGDRRMKHLSAADKTKLLELLRKIERNTKGYDSLSRHGINHEYAVEAIKLLTG